MDVNQVNPNVDATGDLQPIVSDEQVAQAAAELAPLIDPATNLNVEGTRRVDENEKKHETHDVPELDEATVVLADVVADLEALVALLQAEQDEKSIEATKARIDSLRGQLAAHHEQTMGKINESIDEIKKQEKSALANKILGWLGAIVGLVAAVAMCVVTGGAAAGIALAGAIFAVGAQIANETGLTEKLAKAISDGLKSLHPDWSKEACDAWAQGIIAGIQIAVSLACIVGGGFASAGKGLIDASEATMKAVKVGMVIANSVMAGGSLASSTAATIINYDAAEKEAEVTEMQKLLTELQTLLDQESEDLKQLLQKLTDALGAVLDLLQSKQDTLVNITQHIGA